MNLLKQILPNIQTVVVGVGTVGVLAGIVPASHGQTELAKLVASDAAAGDNFGKSIAVNGVRAIVGAWHDASTLGAEAGAAYVFTQGSPTTWVQEAKLVATPSTDRNSGDEFGYSVGISGDFAVVGAWQDATGTTSSAGAAYVFQWSGSTWSQTQKLVAADFAGTDHFGIAVAIDGNVMVVGANRASASASITDAGAVYVFRYNGASWEYEAKLNADFPADSDLFGEVVAVSGDTILVGSRQDDDAGLSSGSAYVFHFNGVSWSQQAKLTASDAGAGDQFGVSVSINGDAAAIGAQFDDNLSGSNAGAAYVFRRTGASWVQEAKLIPVPGEAAAVTNFGTAMAISGDTIVGGSFMDPAPIDQIGAAYVFRFTNPIWTQSAKITASDLDYSDQFGGAVALSGNLLLIGSALDDDFGDASGSAYVFDVGGSADSDGDGLSDADELIWGTNPAIPDSDEDGLVDGIEVELNIFNGTGCPDPLNPDSDNDGLYDGYENDSGPNMCNADVDGDGLLDGEDNCPNVTNADQLDTDGDGIGDACDPDDDNDGLLDGVDNCPNVPNADQLDTDEDGTGDACDPDDDNDTVPDAEDAEPLNRFACRDVDGDGCDDCASGVENAAADGLDTDADGLCDAGDLDDDNDTVADASDADPLNRFVCGDADGDGCDDCGITGGPPAPANDGTDFDADGLCDFGDLDDDMDGVNDADELLVYGSDPYNRFSCGDRDGDGCDDCAVSGGPPATAGDGADFDADGLCNSGDADDDNDGLSDANEIVFSTNPFDSDSDDDGLFDGTEVDSAMGSGCPSPTDADSDDDTRSDGDETVGLTNPCNADTDDDGVPDNLDPTPTTPGVPPAFLEAEVRDLANATIPNLDLSLFTGPNTNANKGRRGSLANRAANAANAIALGDYATAITELDSLLDKIDGDTPPPDWMDDSQPDASDIDGDGNTTESARQALEDQVLLLIALVQLLQ